MLERPDGELIVRYAGRRVATLESSSRVDALWSTGTACPELKRIVSSVGDHHINRSQHRCLATLEPVRLAEAAAKPVVGKDTAAMDNDSKATNPWTRTPTPTQLDRWKAIR